MCVGVGRVNNDDVRVNFVVFVSMCVFVGCCSVWGWFYGYDLYLFYCV